MRDQETKLAKLAPTAGQSASLFAPLRNSLSPSLCASISMILDIVEDSKMRRGQNGHNSSWVKTSRKNEGAQRWPRFNMVYNRTSLNMLPVMQSASLLIHRGNQFFEQLRANVLGKRSLITGRHRKPCCIHSFTNSAFALWFRGSTI